MLWCVSFRNLFIERGVFNIYGTYLVLDEIADSLKKIYSNTHTHNNTHHVAVVGVVV